MAKIPTHPFLLLYHLAAAILGDVKMQYASLLRLPLPLLLLYYCRQPNHMLEQSVVYKNQEENSRWPISTVALTEILFNCSPGLPVFMSIFNFINGNKVKSSTTLKISPEWLSEEHAFESPHASSRQGLTATDEHVYQPLLGEAWIHLGSHYFAGESCSHLSVLWWQGRDINATSFPVLKENEMVWECTIPSCRGQAGVLCSLANFLRGHGKWHYDIAQPVPNQEEAQGKVLVWQGKMWRPRTEFPIILRLPKE